MEQIRRRDETIAGDMAAGGVFAATAGAVKIRQGERAVGIDARCLPLDDLIAEHRRVGAVQHLDPGLAVEDEIGTLDHRMLLPGRHPAISVENVSEKVDGGEEIEVRFGDRRWCFPRSECMVLPVANTTAEALAQCIAEQLLDTLESKTGTRPASVRIEVEESPGLSAVCRLDGEETV